MELLKEFINESKTFNGFVFNGCYNMPKSHFLALLNFYNETGHNLLDDYSSLTYHIWDIGEEEKNGYLTRISDEEDYRKVVELLSNEYLCDFFDSDDIQSVYDLNRKRYELFLRSKSYSVRRIKASLFTNNPNIRRKVFKLYGKFCLSCNCSDNLQLDHVIPVKNGGLDEIDNMQPLCKSCNVKKGTKSIDYRINNGVQI